MEEAKQNNHKYIPAMMEWKEPKMKNGVNEAMNLVRGTKTLPVRQALASLLYLNKQMKLLEDRGADKPTRERIKRAGLEALQVDLMDANKAETERLRGELSTLESNWQKDHEKNYQSNSRKIEAAQRKYRAMTPKELDAEAVRIMSAPYSPDSLPEVHEELVIALKNVSSANAGILREHLVKNNYDKPFMNSQEGKEISGDIDFYKKSLRKILIKNEKGARHELDIDMLGEFLEVEEAEAMQNEAL
jgi:hypothetical protein